MRASGGSSTGGHQARALDALLDVALERDKTALALVDGALACGSAFALALVALVADSPWVTAGLALAWSAAAWVAHALFAGTIARMCQVELARGRRAGIRESAAYALSHLPALALAPLGMVGAAAALVALELAVLQVGRLPGIGDVARAALFLPLVAANAAAVLLVVLGVWLTPAAVAAAGGGVRATVARTWRAVWGHPGPLLGRFLGTIAAVGLTGGVIVGLVVLATSLSLTVATWAAQPTVLPDRLAPPLSAFDLAVLADARTASAGSVVALLVYALYWAGLAAVAAAVPLLVLPVAAACAAWIDVAEPEQPSGTPTGDRLRGPAP